jgi:hypothetical protein
MSSRPNSDSVYGSRDRNGPTTEMTGFIASNILSRENFLRSIRKESDTQIQHKKYET